MESSPEACQWCGSPLYLGDFYEVEPEGWYCHNEGWDINGGTCWQQRVCVDFPEFKEWLAWGFECLGCEVDSDGECTCTSDEWSPGGGM